MTPLQQPPAIREADLTPSVYVAGDAEIHRCIQRDGGIKWAVRQRGSVLGRDLYWGYEPQPSSRDDAFMATYRFSTLQEALTLLNMHNALKAAIATGTQPGAWLVQYVEDGKLAHAITEPGLCESQVRAHFAENLPNGKLSALYLIPTE